MGVIIYLSRYLKSLQKKQTLPKVGYQCRDCHDYSKADYIAFEREKDFILASREELKNFCEERVEQDDRVSSAYEAKYKCYQRAGNKDLITRIRMEDINNFKRNMIFEKITVDS